MAGQGRIEHPVSAGGVVYRKGAGDQLEVILCGRTKPRTWNLPKGTPNSGESIEQTALREVREETGLEVVIEQQLGDIEYWFAAPDRSVRYHKRVHFYLMAKVGGRTDDHDLEFDVIRWFPIGEALDALTYANEVEVLRRALGQMDRQGGSLGR
jgi:8-oxo-dGTP pyrophosphatase MutT (NUDIX family)